MIPSALPDRRALVISTILLVLLVVLAGGMGVIVISDPGIMQSVSLIRAALDIKERYVEEVSSKQLVNSARREMFDLLDRYSGYVEASSFGRMEEEMSGQYGGIGITVVRHELGLLIMSVREDGPAGKAGVMTGNIIISADSTDLADLSVYEASNLLRGEAGTYVSMSVLQPATNDTIEYRLKRETLPLIHIPYAGLTKDSILYIRLLDFEAGVTDQLQAALDSLLPHHPQGLLLDLRGNPGGLFQEAWRTASLFLKEGTFVVGTLGRSRWRDEKLTAVGPDVTDGLPIAILVDGGSASSAEIVSGALQQAGRAILVGDTTFGKGLVQGFVRFPDGDGLRLTISRYYLGNHIFLNELDTALHEIGHGLVPDYLYKEPAQKSVIRELERSFLLYRFVDTYQKEILSSSVEELQSSLWTTRLIAFLKKNDFQYHSSTSDEILTMSSRVKEENASRQIRTLVNDVSSLSEKLDLLEIQKVMNHVAKRLMRIAVERKYGAYRAYKEVIVPLRPDIQYALHLLQKQT